MEMAIGLFYAISGRDLQFRRGRILERTRKNDWTCHKFGNSPSFLDRWPPVFKSAQSGMPSFLFENVPAGLQGPCAAFLFPAQ
jgi:hypothetical protein